ncbi:hypothetical protein [uncultured Megamonas sp.]|uniref:hypothetical protein n=1 Tax=uncultured Megamonas sp. TaxID=286140 RepID=UPI00259B7E1F|nr:hypothetical protein [uncultured Megamonas sp.]
MQAIKNYVFMKKTKQIDMIVYSGLLKVETINYTCSLVLVMLVTYLITLLSCNKYIIIVLMVISSSLLTWLVTNVSSKLLDKLLFQKGDN